MPEVTREGQWIPHPRTVGVALVFFIGFIFGHWLGVSCTTRVFTGGKPFTVTIHGEDLK